MCIRVLVFQIERLPLRLSTLLGRTGQDRFLFQNGCLSVPIWAGPDWIRLFVLDNVQCFVYSRSHLVQAGVYAAQPGLDWHGSTPGSEC